MWLETKEGYVRNHFQLLAMVLLNCCTAFSVPAKKQPALPQNCPNRSSPCRQIIPQRSFLIRHDKLDQKYTPYWEKKLSIQNYFLCSWKRELLQGKSDFRQLATFLRCASTLVLLLLINFSSTVSLCFLPQHTHSSMTASQAFDAAECTVLNNCLEHFENIKSALIVCISVDARLSAQVIVHVILFSRHMEAPKALYWVHVF